MSLITIEPVEPDALLGLWRIEESVADFLDNYPELESEVSQFHRDGRKLERLAVYSLLFAMTDDKTKRISHNAAGKPLVDGMEISISHTRHYVAVILSANRKVAVDIEYMSPRVSKIASRFIRPDEQAQTVESQLLHWSVKETVYKYFSEQNLQYFDMRLHHIGQEDVWVENLIDNSQIKIKYRFTPDYVLTFV